MTHLIISPTELLADRDIEPPLIPGWHSIGGARNVPKHDRAAHAAGLAHVCAQVRSARHFLGDTDMTIPERRRVLADQYRNCSIEWSGWPS
jgi:hypothetical protein